MTMRKVGRDARSGRFVSLRETRRYPSTTVVETVKQTLRKTRLRKKRRRSR